jgi:gluconokinase
MKTFEGLRSVYDLVGGVAHFGRMLDKIRLHAAGKLPEVYVPYLGAGDVTFFDGRVCRFLRVDYDALAARTREGGTDGEVLEWAFTQGLRPTELEIEVFTGFLTKRGWRDQASAGLRADAEASGLIWAEGRMCPGLETFPDLQDAEEGRPLRFGPDPEPFTGTVEPTARIEGLRSPYAKVGGLVHFGRMADKIRLHQAEKLPEDWVKSMEKSNSFDWLCYRFLGVDYAVIKDGALAGEGDEALLERAFAHGKGRPTAEEIYIWNCYMTKRCWRDQYIERVQFRLQEAGMPANAALTMFEFIDLDEGRTPPAWWV